jgi:hypothetical protein
VQLLRLLEEMRLGDVDAAVVLHAISAEKRDDEEIALAAVGRFPKALQFVSERLRANQELVDTATAAEAFLKRDILDRSFRRSLCREPSREPSCDYSSTAATGSSFSRFSELPRTASKWGSFIGEEEA